MYDFVFLHPPVSFKKLQYPLGGLFEAGTGTTDLLTMMPCGMLSLANELHRAGMKTAIVNVAKYLQQIRLGAKTSISELMEQFPARNYGIGLHWSAHASGAFELARFCKQLQPACRVVLGGLSATYFKDEILNTQPAVDAVVLAECDGSMPDIVKGLMHDPWDLTGVPNVAWRADHRIRCENIRAPDLEQVDYVDSHDLIHPRLRRETMERESLLLNLPVIRGCSQNCLFCGGSQDSYRCFFNRDQLGFLSVEKVMAQIRASLARGVGAVKFFGDLRLCGDAYVKRLQGEIAGLPARIDVALEIFWPASREYLKSWREVSRDMFLSVSPESAHPELRELHGKHYDTAVLTDMARSCQDLDIMVWFWFVYILPGHTREKLAGELEAMDRLAEIGPNVTPIIQPYLYIDPGCAVYERPDEYGFDVRLRSLNQIAAAIERPYWFYAIGYRTADFAELDYHQAILDVTRRMAEMYFRGKRLSARDLLKTRKNIDCHQIMGRYLAERSERSDADLQATIESTFPAFLRRSNSNLLIWPFLGAPLDKASSQETVIYDAFPTVLELAMREDAQGHDRVYRLVDDWTRAHSHAGAAMLASSALPSTMISLIADILGPLTLPDTFVGDLTRFEWDVFRLLFFSEPCIEGAVVKPGVVVKSYGFDFVSVDEVLACAGNGRIPAAQPTWYLFDSAKRTVTALNFDPENTVGIVANARIRVMSALGRRVVYADPMMIKVFSRLSNRSDPHLPVVLADGQSVAMDRVWNILRPGEPGVP